MFLERPENIYKHNLIREMESSAGSHVLRSTAQSAEWPPVEKALCVTSLRQIESV